MHRVRLIALAIFTAVLVLSGCNDQKKQNTLLTEESAELRAELDNTKKALDAEMQRAGKDEQMARAAAERKLTEQPAGSTDGVLPANSEGMTWDRTATGVTVTVSGDVLFDSGKATLKASAKKSLDSVAAKTSSPSTPTSRSASKATPTPTRSKRQVRLQLRVGSRASQRRGGLPDVQGSLLRPEFRSPSAGDSRPQGNQARQPSRRNLSRHAVTHSHVHQFTYRSHYRGGQSSSVRRFLFFCHSVQIARDDFRVACFEAAQLFAPDSKNPPSPCLKA